MHSRNTKCILVVVATLRHHPNVSFYKLYRIEVNIVNNAAVAVAVAAVVVVVVVAAAAAAAAAVVVVVVAAAAAAAVAAAVAIVVSQTSLPSVLPPAQTSPAFSKKGSWPFVFRKINPSVRPFPLDVIVVAGSV